MLEPFDQRRNLESGFEARRENSTPEPNPLEAEGDGAEELVFRLFTDADAVSLAASSARPPGLFFAPFRSRERRRTLTDVTSRDRQGAIEKLAP